MKKATSTIRSFCIAGFYILAVLFVLPLARVEASSQGTLRICVAVRNASTGDMLAGVMPTTPIGDFSSIISTSTDFYSAVISKTFNASSFTQNDMIDGVPVECTPYASVDFGSYYYNNVSLPPLWGDMRYFDSAQTFVVSSASAYNDALANIDPSDDILNNNTSDGRIKVTKEQPNRTLIILATYSTNTGQVSSGLISSPGSLGMSTPSISSLFSDNASPSPLGSGLFEISSKYGLTVPGTLSLLLNQPASASCVPGVNMISNGDFEYPVVTTDKKWDIIPFSTPNLGWVSRDASGYGLEIQAGYTEGAVQWLPYSGTQYAEIDGGKYHEIAQVIPTVPGKSYTVTFWTSPRPNQDSSINRMNLFINDVLKETYVASGTPMTAWTKQSYTFVANTPHTRISFVDAKEVSTGTAMYLDSVSVTCDSVVRNMCTLPETLGDATKVVVENRNNEQNTLQKMLDTFNVSLNQIENQKNYQTFSLPSASTTIEVTYVDNGAGGSIVFGYHTSGSLSSFVPVFKTGPYAGFEHIPTLSKGQKIPLTVIDKNAISFAIKSKDTGEPFFSTETSINPDGLRHALVYDISTSTKAGSVYAISFEDLRGLGDHDYNDILVTVEFAQCGAKDVPPPVTNTPPTITLVGANPATLTVGQTWTEPGATASDLEDGNITNKIVITGTVNVNVPGTYTLTYTVTDMGGLSVSKTRTVVVLPVASCVAGANLVSNGGFEYPVVDHPLKWTSVQLSNPQLKWTSYDTISYPYVEVQAGYTEGATQWLPHSGTQYAEIDGGTSHDVSQILATIPGRTYTVSYWVSPRPNISSEFNRIGVSMNGSVIDTVIASGTPTTSWSQRTSTFTATTTETRISFTQGQNIQTGVGVFLDDVSVVCNPVIVTNTPPTITLVGANPATLTVGQTWTEPGATASDLEDGNITNKIVITGTVNVNVPGTYTLTYTVTDMGGLSASTTRQVIVANGGGSGPTTGSIRFCSIFANKDNVITTSSTNLPDGTLAIKLATTTNFANSTIQSKTWTASAFAPNAKIISSQNDADCVAFNDLPFGTYYYSELSISGSLWIVSSTSPRYNDQLTTPVNNIFDMFAYSGELFTATSTDDASRNVNSDGQIIVSADRREHTLVIATQHQDKPIDVGCPTCGGGTVTPPGGGGNGPIVTSLSITNEKVVEITPGVALVTWNTNLPATKEVGYGNTSQPASFIVAPFGYATSTPRVSEPLTTVHSYTIAIEPGKTYYFRPVSTDGKTTVAGIELVLNPVTRTGGNETPKTCYYLFDYLKQGWNNNPVEVKKLQVFLRDLEGFNVEVNGIYDNQTVVALNAFQNRYKADILTPWGHTAPTSFTYITTKKKVNEIYCKMAFPVTAQQQSEIDAYRAFLQGLSRAGVVLTAPTTEQINKPVIIDTTDVGVLPELPTSSQVTLAGTTSTSTFVGQLTANAISSTKRLGNLAGAIFGWPWGWVENMFGGEQNQCSDKTIFSNWFNWILIIVILTMGYLWYRERQENKKTQKLNEELDLINK